MMTSSNFVNTSKRLQILKCACVLALVAVPVLHAAETKPKEKAVEASEDERPKSLWKRMGGFKVGDWAEYVLPTQGNAHCHREIMEVGDHTVVLKVKFISNGKIEESALKLTYDGAELGSDDPHTKIKESTEKIKVLDKEVTVTRIDTLTDGKLTGSMWFTSDVPIDGIVKLGEGPECKTITMQLVSFGRGK
jgi:hypothetical protein